MGLFGYYHGERTIFLNSDNGSARFGKSGAGQIVIDPTKDQEALIYGGNYSTKNGTGMLINLSDPSINFGSGKFNVDDKGHLTAKGGGSIAGWNIGDNSLTSKIGNITLRNNGSIYSNSHSSIDNSNNGFFLSEQGLSIGSKIKISNTGVVTVGPGAVNNKNKYHWTIDGDTSRAYIAYGGETKVNTADSTTKNSAKVYLGTDGISLGERFSVTAQGSLRAYSGEIGGWTIGSTTLSANNIIINSTGTISGGNYKADTRGWQITGKGEAEFNNATIRGTVTADSGSIGGWKIRGSSLKSQNDMITLYAGSTDSKTIPYIQVGSTIISYIKINSDGSIQSKGYEPGSGWRVDGKGNATFNQGIFGPWKIGKDKNKTKVFEGNTEGNSIRLYANGNVYGMDLSVIDSSKTNSSDYWEIVNGKASFGHGIYVGRKNSNGWQILPWRTEGKT